MTENEKTTPPLYSWKWKKEYLMELFTYPIQMPFQGIVASGINSHFTGKEMAENILLKGLAPLKRCFPKIYRNFQKRLFLNPYANGPYFFCLFVYITLTAWTFEGIVRAHSFLSLPLAYLLYVYKKTWPDAATYAAYMKLLSKVKKKPKLLEKGWSEFQMTEWIEIAEAMEELRFSLNVSHQDDMPSITQNE